MSIQYTVPGLFFLPIFFSYNLSLSFFRLSMSPKSFTKLHLSVLKVIFSFFIPTSTYIQCNCSTLSVLKTRFEPTTLGLGCSRNNQYPITAALIESLVHSSTLFLQLFFLIFGSILSTFSFCLPNSPSIPFLFRRFKHGIFSRRNRFNIWAKISI